MLHSRGAGSLAIYTLISFIVLVILCLFFGMIFSVVEADDENFRNDDIVEIQELLARMCDVEPFCAESCAVGNTTNTTGAPCAADQLLPTHLTRLCALLQARGNLYTTDYWGYWNSVMYALTTSMTLGYGATAPRSHAGQVWTVIWVLIGIPVALFFAFCAGSLIIAGLRTCLMRSPREAGAAPTPGRYAAVIAVIMVILFGPILFGAAALLVAAEDAWTYWDALWFSFTTIATVTFGPCEGRYPFNTVPEDGAGVTITMILVLLLWVLLAAALLLLSDCLGGGGTRIVLAEPPVMNDAVIGGVSVVPPIVSDEAGWQPVVPPEQVAVVNTTPSGASVPIGNGGWQSAQSAGVIGNLLDQGRRCTADGCDGSANDHLQGAESHPSGRVELPPASEIAASVGGVPAPNLM